MAVTFGCIHFGKKFTRKRKSKTKFLKRNCKLITKITNNKPYRK